MYMIKEPLQKGDLVFWIDDPSSAANNNDFTTAVTESASTTNSKKSSAEKYEEANGKYVGSIYHVSLIAGDYKRNESLARIAVIHATQQGVKHERLAAAIKHVITHKNSKKRVIFMHLSTVSDEDKDKAVTCAASVVGLPYNDIFADNLINSQGQRSFYCCQLVRWAYDNASRGLFPTRSMTFLDKRTAKTLPYWKEYFAQRHATIPEGTSGSHPSDLYRTQGAIVVANISCSDILC